MATPATNNTKIKLRTIHISFLGKRYYWCVMLHYYRIQLVLTTTVNAMYEYSSAECCTLRGVRSVRLYIVHIVNPFTLPFGKNNKHDTGGWWCGRPFAVAPYAGVGIYHFHLCGFCRSRMDALNMGSRTRQMPPWTPAGKTVSSLYSYLKVASVVKNGYVFAYRWKMHSSEKTREPSSAPATGQSRYLFPQRFKASSNHVLPL